MKGCDFAVVDENVFIHYRECTAMIPAGFRFDGASIPRWAWSILGLHPWHPRVRRAALYHDFMYSKGYKKTADKGFKSLLKEDGCNQFQYMACYIAVRLFGRKYVKKKRG